ncbi:hypothetical protein [Burkholderia vietnamiensis]|uniref:hypothetical protein n=1 Tax=Burkholderia vietnamiensis TaxID=60552 RepID=UPI001B92B400|nr:hypothetical protein [Burkholderia vietnamiensis]MBR8147029.1 hypothetical protein [Burkholderia vietnamiensis]
MKIRKLQIIAFTNGEYSDYCLRDHMRALSDFDTADKIAEFKATAECQAANSWEQDDVFMAWLVKTGVVEPLGDAVIEWHVGSYGALTP